MIRCHALGKIMTEPKDKKEILSVGAKTYLNQLAKESVYEYRPLIKSKYLDKGIICEDEAIRLYNEVYFTDLVKNTERRNNGLISGECDLYIPEKRGIDIKCSWSLDTFPVLTEDCHDKDYEWQCRGYMMLFDVPVWDVAYCLVSTPDELIWEGEEDLHYVDHIDPVMRITTIRYERDLALEDKIKEKASAAITYIAETKKRILSIHSK